MGPHHAADRGASARAQAQARTNVEAEAGPQAPRAASPRPESNRSHRSDATSQWQAACDRPSARDPPVNAPGLFAARASAWASVGVWSRFAARAHPVAARSGVSPEVARARAYQSSPRGLDIPIWDARGCQQWVQARLDNPRSRRQRYHNGPGAVQSSTSRPTCAVGSSSSIARCTSPRAPQGRRRRLARARGGGSPGSAHDFARCRGMGVHRR